jgi:hypothetical protein
VPKSLEALELEIADLASPLRDPDALVVPLLELIAHLKIHEKRLEKLEKAARITREG